MVHYYYPISGQALCHSFVRGSHLLPSQLPGEYTGHKAASRCSEPFWNAHYSSTCHHCWYSFYLPIEGWRAESTPNQVESGVGIQPGTCHINATALPTELHEQLFKGNEIHSIYLLVCCVPFSISLTAPLLTSVICRLLENDYLSTTSTCLPTCWGYLGEWLDPQ